MARGQGQLCPGPGIATGWRRIPTGGGRPLSDRPAPPNPADRHGDDEDLSASLYLALAVSKSFGLKLADAKAIAGEVGEAVGGWRQEAARIGIRESEIDRMVSAFEHEDMEAARRL
jgi:serine/threonine-protein kinase HipA